MTVVLAVAILALATFSGTLVYVARAIHLHINDQTQPVMDPAQADPWGVTIRDEIKNLHDRIDKLTLAVDEGITRVSRAENRVAKTVTSARRLVREAGLDHPGIEAEYAELQSPDAGGNEPLPAVSEEVAATRTVRIPGGSLEIGAA